MNFFIYNFSKNYKKIDLNIIYNDFEKLLNLLKEKNSELKKDDLYNYLDIGSSLSLLLIENYLKNNVIIDIDSFDFKNENVYNFFYNLYSLCNLISTPNFITTISYNKKLILFSLFSGFNISAFPNENKFLNLNTFKLFKYINGGILNCNSILFHKNFNFF